MPAPSDPAITAAMIERTPKAVLDRIASLQRSYDDLRLKYNTLKDTLSAKTTTNTAVGRYAQREEKTIYLPNGTRVSFSLAPYGYAGKHSANDDAVVEVFVKYDHKGEASLCLMAISAVAIFPHVTNVFSVTLPAAQARQLAQLTSRERAATLWCGAVFKDGRKCTRSAGHIGPHADRGRTSKDG